MIFTPIPHRLVHLVPRLRLVTHCPEAPPRPRTNEKSRTALSFAIVLTLMACLTACRKQPPTSVETQVTNVTKQEPVKEPVKEPTQPALSSTQPSQRNLALPKLTAKKTAALPDITEWETEKLNELAARQLKELGEQLTTSTPLRCETLISASSVANSLFPADAPVVYEGSEFSVRRIASQHDVPNTPLRTQLISLHQANAWKQSKFKIIRVNKGEKKTFTTKAYCHFSGRTKRDDANVEMNATWDIDWQLSAEGQPWISRITSLTAEYASMQQGAMFRDVTWGVLSRNEVYWDCIMPSISSLRERIEHRLGVYNLGHHGIAIGDVDGDDFPDVYVCQTGGLPNHLFINDGDGSATDVADEFRVDYLDNTRAALLIDLDNDADQDLVLTLSSGMLILENTGRGRFRERARIRSVKQGFSLSAADFNNDGLLDIYVCVYYGSNSNVSELPVPVPYFDATNGGENHLIVNEGNWSFRDGTDEAKLNEDNSRFSFASAWDDFDSDGDQDLLVVNDFGPNQLFRNTDGTFENVAKEVGLVDGAFGMSASFGDFNRDGRSDIYVANMFSAAGNRITTQDKFKPHLDEEVRKKFLHLARGNSLFESRGEKFSDVSVERGVTVGRWSWGSVFADVNNDGWEDLLVGNGYVTGESKDDL